jgi:hypothetical protein
MSASPLPASQNVNDNRLADRTTIALGVLAVVKTFSNGKTIEVAVTFAESPERAGSIMASSSGIVGPLGSWAIRLWTKHGLLGKWTGSVPVRAASFREAHLTSTGGQSTGITSA